jgi:hypothetical protein
VQATTNLTPTLLVITFNVPFATHPLAVTIL